MLSCCVVTAVGTATRTCYGQSVSTNPGKAKAASLKNESTVKPLPHVRTEEPSGLGEMSPSAIDANNSLGLHVLKSFAEDQRNIWTSPRRLKFSDTEWLVPLAGITAGLIETDHEFGKHLSSSPNRLNESNTLSNYGIGALVGAGAGLYLWGHITHNDHERETGFLAGEAAVDSLAVTYAAKYAFRRERPLGPNSSGRFWQGGDSFPSEHASAAWSIASVIAHEYPGPLTSLFSYGLASAITASRVSAKQHFPSDVFIGSMIGWFVGQEVYHHHHDPELGGGAWPSIGEIVRGEGESGPANQGSPYVPLDSWIYPALERLMALGVIKGGFLGMRPWTRSECARLLDQAEDSIDAGTAGPEAEKIFDRLAVAFRDERNETMTGSNVRARIESIYSRVTTISGKPLTDGYNFGQTISNDFGRPYQEGVNTVDGISAWATAGRWVGYVRAEYQHAPSAPALSTTPRQTIATMDSIPVIPPATPFASVNRVELLDAYAGLNFDNWQLTFGRQNLWWGPSKGGPLVLSDNAEPINMFRVDRISPFGLPGPLGFLGPVRAEFFIGQLTGQKFFDTPSGIVGSWTQAPTPQPLIDGWDVSFKPTPNLELGFSYTTMFGGLGVPTTAGTFLNAVLDTGGELPDTTSKSSRDSGLDFTYRVPGLRKWLTVYGEGFAHDQLFFVAPQARPLPFGYPDRAAWNAGIYVPAFPGLPKLDFRMEGGFTNSPNGVPHVYDSGFYYTANRYLNGYTNNGNLLGSWIGRAGQGLQAWSNYWLSARNRVEVNFRHLTVSHDFIPGGETVNDGSVKVDWWLGNEVGLSAQVQYERWLAPILASGPQTDWTSSVQVAFHPASWGW